MSEIDKTGHNQKARLSKSATISVVLGLLGLVIWILSVRLNPLVLLELLATSLIILPQTFGVLFAVLALHQIKKSGRLLIGKDFAITGLAVSILALPLPLWLFVGRLEVYCKSQVIRIDDATQGMTVQLSNEDRREFIDAIDIFITGNIDGSATVDAYKEIPVSGNIESAAFDVFKEAPVYIRPYVVQGKVQFEIREEWYDDVCFFKYEPIDVRFGSLKVRYYLYASPYTTAD